MKLHDFFQVRDRFFRLAGSVKNLAEIVSGTRIDLRWLDGDAKMLDGLGILARPEESDAQTVVGRSIVGTQLNGPLETFDGFGKLAELQQGQAQIVTADREVGFDI